MSISSVIQQLEKIELLQKSLNKMAERKTEAIKKGDVEELSLLVKDEQKHLTAIKQLEMHTVKMTKNLLPEHESPILSDLINIAQGDEKGKLEKVRIQLGNEVAKLKLQNQLNQELLKQSLQYINLNLDLLLPEIDSYNYDRPDITKDQEEPNRSLFDSKA